MKNMILLAAMFIGSSALAQNVSGAKVAELTVHRIDRLVQTKKIDSTFASRLSRIDISQAGPAPAAYRSVVSQTQPAQGGPLQVELIFDKDGKPLSFKALVGGVAGPDPKFNGGASAVTLLENALHEVFEYGTDPQTQPFDAGFASVTLSKGTLQGGEVARAQILSSSTTQKLSVYLMLDGMFMSKEITP